MKIFEYIKKNGLNHSIKILWRYKVEILLEKVINIFTKNKDLKDSIIIESHNDFDCNGGAIYDYLIKNDYNKNYKIVWLIRKKIKTKLPYNVTTVPLYGPSLRKAYYICTSKYVTFDCEQPNKIRNDQIVVYCSHGAGGLKNIVGKTKIPDSVNYILMQSEEYMPIQAKQWSLQINDPRLIYIGYPCQDVFFNDQSRSELLKITKNKYNKIILWMPTFRKNIDKNRNDSYKEQKFGVPLLDDISQLYELNDNLKKKNIFLIIKIHPKQDLSDLDLRDCSNVIILTGDAVKKLNIDNYKLITCADALISDYSGAAYDFLQLDRPIGYVLDDMKYYKSGFVIDNIHELIAGHEIYNINDLYNFINDVYTENDKYNKKRKKIRNYIYNCHDGKSCERLMNLLGLKK